ncbi:MAG TPA: hypothetical protein VLG76_07710 [Rhabdochlamydiaceae bacterium]|nr:hypothetical protein [Rhabdochlamydiaceae bacterium]
MLSNSKNFGQSMTHHLKEAKFFDVNRRLGRNLAPLLKTYQSASGALVSETGASQPSYIMMEREAATL